MSSKIYGDILYIYFHLRILIAIYEIVIMRSVMICLLFVWLIFQNANAKIKDLKKAKKVKRIDHPLHSR